MEYTEFDEQATDKTTALRLLASKHAQFQHGRETMAIVDAYERAALKAGCTVMECERAVGGFKEDIINDDV